MKRWTTHWSRHPAVRSGKDLTLGQRSADFMRNGMGSWPFVFGFLLFMAVWAVTNRTSGVDPYPFILLNLFLSALAGLQGAILLIAAKRADQVSSELAVHTFDRTVDITALLKANTDLTRQVQVLTEAIHGFVSRTDE